MRSNNSKNSAVSSSSVLEDCWGKGISSIGRGPPFVQVRAVCPSPPQLLHLLGDRFFGDSDSAIIISNSDSALRMVSAGAHAFYWRFWRPVSASKNSVPGGQVLRTKSYRTRVLSLGPPQFGILGRRCNYSGLSPSASNCRLHSVGGSRRRSTPMQRGRRPFTAALTRLTCRTLHFSRAQSCATVVTRPEMIG